jgi:hypothetical protein
MWAKVVKDANIKADWCNFEYQRSSCLSVGSIV